jgi:hypothetical protein
MKVGLYLEIAGFLSVLAQRHVAYNLPEQAQELLDKLSDALAEEHPDAVSGEAQGSQTSTD